MTAMNKRRLKLAALALVPVVVVATVAAVKFSGGRESLEDIPTFEVRRGPLTISVDASGSIKALDQIVIKCQVEGVSTILSLIPEGTRVKKGDLLIELDSSAFEDMLVAEQIRLQNAETTLISAQENLAVGKNQAESDLEKAQLALDFAKEDLKKYIEGDYQNELTDANSQIEVKREAVEQAKDQYEWSLKLFKEKYVSESELKRDKLALSRAELELKLAESKLRLLKDFTYHRTVKELESNVWQAEMALERAKRKAKADVVLLEAALFEAQANLEKQKEVVKKLETNIANTKITAPADGMVVYATSQRGSRWGGNQQPLDEGQQVYERQELIHLPTTDQVKAEVKIHESSMEKVEVGLPVIVTVDAVPGRSFKGHVAKIALLPDAQMVWLNPDLKVYRTEIHLDEDANGLRTGMSCRASIIVKEYEDVLYIPVQAVVRIGEQPTVFVLKNGRREPRPVEIGLDNNRMVHILSGLEVGEEVVLNPPLAPAEVPGAKVSGRRRPGNRPQMAPAGAGTRKAGRTAPEGPAARPGGAGDSRRAGRPPGGAPRRPPGGTAGGRDRTNQAR